MPGLSFHADMPPLNTIQDDTSNLNKQAEVPACLCLDKLALVLYTSWCQMVPAPISKPESWVFHWYIPQMAGGTDAATVG